MTSKLWSEVHVLVIKDLVWICEDCSLKNATHLSLSYPTLNVSHADIKIPVTVGCGIYCVLKNYGSKEFLWQVVGESWIWQFAECKARVTVTPIEHIVEMNKTKVNSCHLLCGFVSKSQWRGAQPQIPKKHWEKNGILSFFWCYKLVTLNCYRDNRLFGFMF